MATCCDRNFSSRHCEEPPGRRYAPPEDRLRDEAISGQQRASHEIVSLRSQ